MANLFIDGQWCKAKYRPAWLRAWHYLFGDKCSFTFIPLPPERQAEIDQQLREHGIDVRERMKESEPCV